MHCGGVKLQYVIFESKSYRCSDLVIFLCKCHCQDKSDTSHQVYIQQHQGIIYQCICFSCVASYKPAAFNILLNHASSTCISHYNSGHFALVVLLYWSGSRRSQQNQWTDSKVTRSGSWNRRSRPKCFFMICVPAQVINAM